MHRDLRGRLNKHLIGQASAVDAIVPFVEAFAAGFAPPKRPAGVFMLLGPTGVGKTRTVEVLAKELHGDERKMIRVDCGELKQEHDICRLKGAPPGYLGHRETPPLITAGSLSSACSDSGAPALVLFDEIEKAHISLSSVLLGILDKGVLRTGDARVVDFSSSMIFMSSNLGADRMRSALDPEFRLPGVPPSTTPDIDRIAVSAALRHYPPEFMNRIDKVISYRPLNEKDLRSVLRLEVSAFEAHVKDRQLAGKFSIKLTEAALEFLIQKGNCQWYGARELKRAIQSQLLHPLATAVLESIVSVKGPVEVDWSQEEGMSFQQGKSRFKKALSAVMAG